MVGMAQFTLKQLLCAVASFAMGCAAIAPLIANALEYNFATKALFEFNFTCKVLWALVGAGFGGAVGILVKRTWQGMAIGTALLVMAWAAFMARLFLTLS
jgi:hypothetical protein